MGVPVTAHRRSARMARAAWLCSVCVCARACQYVYVYKKG